MQMPKYATHSDVPSIYDKTITGYAVDAELSVSFFYYQPFIVYSTVFGAVSLFLILGLSTPLFVTIVESIETTEKGKPKLYYHFWSSVLLIIVGVWGYEMILNYNRSISYIHLILMVTNSFLGLLIALLTAARGENKIILFSAPLSECGCNYSRCVVVWSWIMTIVGFFVILSFIVYLLYAIPTIVFVYYLYPTRTLIRVPFILGAVFYTIALMSLVLYLLEKVTMMIFSRNINYNVCRCCALCCNLICKCCLRSWEGKSDSDPGEQTPLGMGNIHLQYTTEQSDPESGDDRIYPGLKCLYYIRKSVKHIVQQHSRNESYYTLKITEDLSIISGQCCLLVGILQLLAGVIILAAYIFAELVLADLVFKQTTQTSTVYLHLYQPFSFRFLRGLIEV